MTSSNMAAWIDAPYAGLQVRAADMPAPAPGQLVVQVRAVAVNPLDAVIQSNGKMMYGWLSYPVILGEDVAGVITGVGSGVSGFAVGDRVVAYAMGLEKGEDPRAGSAFQRFVAVNAALTCPLSDHIDFADAVVLPLTLTTAAAGLFETGQLGLDHTALGSAAPREEIVVIWGGATGVGGNAIQLARAAGYRVLTTASPRNHERMRELGAEAVFDYHDADVVQQIVAAAAGSPVVGVLAIATGSAGPCVAIATATGAKKVAMASPPVSFYDQPRRSGFSLARIRLIATLGSRSAAVMLRSRLAGVRASFIWGSAIASSDVGPAVWQSYLPAALRAGTHSLYPPSRQVGTSLSDIQAAMDTLRDGVSAEKLVITLP